MLRTLYELEKCNVIIYDGIHEYCLAEKLNEEQLRASIKKGDSANKPIKMHGITTGFSTLLAVPVKIINSIRQSIEATTTTSHPVKRIIKK
ncbi:MAG TPA: hypothetical protein PK629_00720 [Oscillospiraceae bacterium]|nr:hypothetical protein [Oscillospiraceae bacterium]HPK34534.1 hypothetical protein [Oscillospiraceae bacterium]HPR74762.1 hypothetical protein [Oscillospiraceae bacterium]